MLIVFDAIIMIYVLFMCLCDMSVVLIEARRGYHNF